MKTEQQVEQMLGRKMKKTERQIFNHFNGNGYELYVKSDGRLASRSVTSSPR